MPFGFKKKDKKAVQNGDDKTEAEGQQRVDRSGSLAGMEGGNEGEGMGMSEASLRQFLTTFYLYKMTTPGEELYGDFSKLDDVKKIVASGNPPEAIISVMKRKYGEGPPPGWTPRQYGKKSREDVLVELGKVFEMYGQEPPERKNVEGQLDSLYDQKMPYESLLETVEKTLRKKAAVVDSTTPTATAAATTPVQKASRPQVLQLEAKQIIVDPSPVPTPSQAALNTSSASQLASNKFYSVGTEAVTSQSGMRSLSNNNLSNPQMESTRRPSRRSLEQQQPPQQQQQSRVSEEDYVALFQEVQLLKMTIQEQVEAHKELIELQRNQQAFINEFLSRQTERYNDDAMVRQAEVLQLQYNTALSQWDGKVGRTMGGGQVTSPIYHSSPPGSPRCKGVKLWLENLGLEGYAEVFSANEIDFQSLTLLTEDDLIRMGVAALGPRKTLMNAVAELQHHQVRESPKARSRHRQSSRARPPRDAPKPPPLSPPKWTAHVDAKSSRVYYYNSESGESKWDVPAAGQFSPEVYTDLL